MTAEEYTRLYRQARKRTPSLMGQAMTELKRIYIKAGKLAAAEVRRAELAGLSDLTIQSWANIEQELLKGADLIRTETSEQIINKVSTATGRTSAINQQYLFDAIDKSGESLNRITTASVRNLYQSVNTSVLESLVTRIYKDGYTFSTRIWNVGLDYQKQIKDVISAGIAQGRSTVQIAKDLQVYISDGKIELVNRFGTLERGTSEFMKHVGNKVDYRALRLVRSELYASLQEASALQGKANPACQNLYDWFLELGRQHWNCACPDNQAGSPYTLEELPDYPHSNCRCDVRPRLMDGKQFNEDLKAWVNGAEVGYLDDWYNTQYQLVA